jgi:Na+/H+ antiporter NhaD/arsenite permease-like protein
VPTYLKRTSHVVEIDAAMDNSERARRLLFAKTLFALTMVILLLPVTKFTLDIPPFGHASIFVAFLGAAAIYCRLRSSQRSPSLPVQSRRRSGKSEWFGLDLTALMPIASASRNDAISSSA